MIEPFLNRITGIQRGLCPLGKIVFVNKNTSCYSMTEIRFNLCAFASSFIHASTASDRMTLPLLRKPDSAVDNRKGNDTSPTSQ